MPEPRSRTDTPVCPSSCLNPTQNQNRRANRGLSHDQTKRMRQILRKQCDQRCRKSQVTQRHKLKHPASRPRHGNFAPQKCTKRSSAKFRRAANVTSLQNTLPHRNRIIPLPILVSLKMTHALNPAFARTACNASSLSFFLCDLCALCVLCVNVFSAPQHKTVQSLRRAMRAKSFDGFTAAGFPTISSIHLSFAVSPYAKHRDKSKPASAAIRLIARAFASPNIASPTIRPVHASFFTSSRVAQTRIALFSPRASSSASIALAVRCAKGSSVPLTITSKCSRSACHAIRSIASGKNEGSLRESLSAPLTPHKYILFVCKI